MQKTDITTGTDLLITILDRLKEGEAEDMLIVYTDHNGCLRLKSNCNCSRAIGLAHWAEAELTQDLLNCEGGDVQ